MRSKLLLALIFFVGLAIRMNAQSDAKKQEPAKSGEMTPEQKKAFEDKLRKRMYAARKVSMDQKTANVNSSLYNYREKEIFNRLAVDEIPASFPQYNKSFTNEQYTVMMEKWYSANPTLVKSNSTNEQK